MTTQRVDGGGLVVLDAVARSLTLMWRFLGTAVGLTVVVILPVEWVLNTVGLRGGMGYADPARMALATFLSLIAGLWATAALLRVIDARETGTAKSWPVALFECLDTLPWLCVNATAVVVAIAAAAAVMVGLISVVLVATLMPAGLSGAYSDFGSVGMVLVLVLAAVSVGAVVWIGSLMVRWTLVTPVVVLEARHWALERSSQLTRGRRWRCFAVIMVVGAVLSVGLAVVGAVVFSLSGGMERAVQALTSGNNMGVQLALGFTGLLYSATYYVLLDALGGGGAARATAPSPGSDEPSPRGMPVEPPRCQEVDGG
jgi:hypothetical protein